VWEPSLFAVHLNIVGFGAPIRCEHYRKASQPVRSVYAHGEVGT
jgi:hypothetical protein